MDDKSRIFVEEDISIGGDLDLGLEDGSYLDLDDTDTLDISKDNNSLDLGETDGGLDLIPGVSRDFNLSLSEVSKEDDNFNLFAEQNIESDKERFEEIVNRMRRYNSSKLERKDKNRRVREFAETFVKTVLDKRDNSKVILNKRQITQIGISAKAIASQLSKATIMSDVGESMIRTLESSGFPMEVLYSIDNNLEWELQKLIQSVKSELDELDNAQQLTMQSITSAVDNDYSFNKGLFLTDVETIKYDMVRRKQTVVCPTCGVETEHNLLGFNKTRIELGRDGYKTLFEIRPLVCICGELIVLSEDSTTSLEAMMSQHIVNLIAEDSLSERVDNQIIQPPEYVLERIKEIELKGMVISTKENLVEIESLVSKYKSQSKGIVKEELKKILKDTKSEKDSLRFNILVKNSLTKDNSQSKELEELIVSTTLQIPLIIEIINLKKRIRGVERNILNLTKTIKVMEYLLINEVKEDTEFDKHNSIAFVNSVLTTELNTHELKEEDYEDRIVAEKVLKGIKDELNRLIFLRDDLNKATKRYKEEFLNNPLIYYLPAKNYTSGASDYGKLYSILDSDEEIKEFRRKAIEPLSIKHWFKSLLEINRGRLDRSNKYYKEHEDLKKIRKTLDFVTVSRTEDKRVEELKNLFSLDMPELDSCLRELDKRNSKYRFIYKVLDIVKEYSSDPYVEGYMEHINKYIEDEYKLKKKMFTIEQFEKYFILLDLGFDKDLVQEKVVSGEAKIDCRSLAVIDKKNELEEYIRNFKTSPKYVGEFVSLDKDTYEILLILKKLEQWSTDSIDDMHRLIKYKILEYVYVEFQEGEGLFRYCDRLVRHGYDINDEFDYNNIMTEMHKGKMLLKDLFEESEIMNVELKEEIGNELKKVVGEIALLDNLTTMNVEDAIRRIMEESDTSYLKTESLDIYIRYLLGKEILDKDFKLNIEPLLTEDIKKEVEIYYIILNSKVDEIEIISKITDTKRDKLMEKYSDILIKLCKSVREINTVSYENLRVLIEGGLGIEF